MASQDLSAHIEVLPAELLSRLFESLSSNGKFAGIASSRLVSRRWCEISSPFLISTVVIADRVGMLQKLLEVVEHPYYSKHVTNLIWDASEFDEELASSFEKYKHDIMAQAWTHPTKTNCHDNSGISSLLRGAPNLSALASQRERYPRPAGTSRDVLLSRKDYDQELISFERLHRGYTEYFRHRRLQDILQERRLSLRYLHLAFAKLPKLRSFEFTDFSALSREGETFDGLCRRLFGDMMYPSPLSGVNAATMKTTGWHTLFECLCNLLKIHPKLEALNFGHNDFQSLRAAVALDEPLVRLDNIHVPEDKAAWNGMLPRIQHLMLPIDITSRSLDGASRILKNDRKILSYFRASLPHLELTTTPL